MFIKRSIKIFIIVIAAVALASRATAFAAANTVPPTKAGDGNSAISGYVITGVHYVLASPPTTITSLTFNVDTAPIAGSTITVKLVTGGSWYTCTNVTTAVTCAIPGLTVLSVDNLQVVISD